MTLNKLSQISTVVLALIFTTASLRIAQSVLMPLVLALLIYALVLPGIDFLVRQWRFPRGVALLVSILVCFMVAGTAILFCFVSISNFSVEASTYRARILEAVASIQGYGQKWGVDLNLEKYLWNFNFERIWDWGQLVTANILSLISYVGLVGIYLLFLLLGKSRSDRWPRPVVEVQASMSRYVWVKSLLALVMGTVVGLVLAILGGELTLLFSFLTFFLNFIPTVGSLLSIAMPLPVLWLQFGFGMPFWVFLGVAGTAQFYVGNFLEPDLMGKNMDLHPVTIMFFLVFWSFVWGMAGAFLAVPLTVIIKTVLERIPSTKRIAALMSGRFYFDPTASSGLKNIHGF